MIFELSECESIIGYKFKNLELFRQCFIHSSYTNEHPWEGNNERLEFFGDKIIDFIVTEFLYNEYPEEDEGKLTERRKNLVSKEPLTEVVFGLGLDKYIVLGNGIVNDRDPSEKFYSSLYEAIVAGMYIDGGFVVAKKFVQRTLLTAERLKKTVSQNKKTAIKDGSYKDFKSALQEFTQKVKLDAPVYKTLSKTGPDNNPVFIESVSVNGQKLAEGSGKNKKTAQQQAAEKAYAILSKGGISALKKKNKLDAKNIQKQAVKKPIKAKADTKKTVKKVKSFRKSG